MIKQDKLDPQLLQEFLQDVEGHDAEWVLAYLRQKIRESENGPYNPACGFYDALYKDIDGNFNKGSSAPIPDWINYMS